MNLKEKIQPFLMEAVGVFVDTGKFERSHQKKPSGTGNWLFQIGQDEKNQFSAKNEHGSTSLKYADALKLAKAEAKKQAEEKKIKTIYVYPLP